MTAGGQVAARAGTAGLVVAWCLLGVGDALHAGYYSGVALTCVAAGFVVLAAILARGSRFAPPDRPVIAGALLVALVLAIVNPTRAYLYQHGARLSAIEALAIATAGAAFLLTCLGDQWRARAWWLVAAVAAATGIVTIALIRDPHIDVWSLLQQSSTGLLHGRDMYRQHWSDSTGLQAVYPYLPVTTVLLAPFRWIFGDVRVGLLVAILLTALIVRRHGGARSELVSTLLLVAPGWVLLVNRSWTEPLLVLLLAGAVIAIRSDRGGLAVVALAAALACKQHVVFLLPVFAVWPAFGLRRTVTAAALAILAVLPWVIAGPRDFWHDAVHANLVLGTRGNSLDLPALLLRHGDHVGFWFAAVFLVAAYAIVLARVPRTPSGLALGCALVMWAFDLANRQTYFNHYQLPLGLIVVGLALAGDASERRGNTGAARPVPVSPPLGAAISS
jgi:hypothetical protein